jgi:hypothetical protein
MTWYPLSPASLPVAGGAVVEPRYRHHTVVADLTDTTYCTHPGVNMLAHSVLLRDEGAAAALHHAVPRGQAGGAGACACWPASAVPARRSPSCATTWTGCCPLTAAWRTRGGSWRHRSAGLLTWLPGQFPACLVHRGTCQLRQRRVLGEATEQKLPGGDRVRGRGPSRSGHDQTVAGTRGRRWLAPTDDRTVR